MTVPHKYVKKTILLDQDYIDKAVKFFNVKTEKEAVNQALKVVVEESEIINTHTEIASSGIIEDIYK